MLGWEFPPFISGGLGTACYGMTKALDRAGMEVSFVLPKPVNSSHASHVRLVHPAQVPSAGTQASSGSGQTDGVAAARAPTVEITPRLVRRAGLQRAQGGAGSARTDPMSHWDEPLSGSGATTGGTMGRLGFLGIGGDSQPGPYDTMPRAHRTRRAGRLGGFLVDDFPGDAGAGTGAGASSLTSLSAGMGSTPPGWTLVDQVIAEAVPEAIDFDVPEQSYHFAPVNEDYAGDLVTQAERYAHFCVSAARQIDFDVIHAHDWLTYPAGIALARLTGRPLVVHVHSTEFDRSGEHVNQAVYNIERRGMHAAVRVVTVSMLTRNLCVNRYGVSPAKIDVVYNGVDLDPTAVGIEPIRKGERIVLYFGRITMQKGPEFFVRAAKRVLEVEKNVRFVVAGSGDQAQRMIEMAAELGIGSRMTFTGFLRGRDIPRVFAMADVYVMPSVSEPFGIAPLEALAHRVPVIISRTSGVSEVLTNALKVDFWDVDDIANKIVAVLRHPPLRAQLRDEGFYEIRGIGWDGAATRLGRVYDSALSAVRRPVGV